jgi:putative transposase
VIYHTPLQSPAHKSHDYPCHVAITLRVESGQSELLVRHISLLRDCVALSKRRWDFVIQAAAVLPAEMHLLCVLLGADITTRAARSALLRRRLIGMYRTIAPAFGLTHAR